LKNGLQSRRKVKVERRAMESFTLQDIDREIGALASPAFRLRSRLFHREALSSCRRAVYSLLSPLSGSVPMAPFSTACYAMAAHGLPRATKIPVISRANLIENKRASGRGQDLADVDRLEQS